MLHWNHAGDVQIYENIAMIAYNYMFFESVLQFKLLTNETIDL